MNRNYRELIANEFRNCVTNTIRRIQGEATIVLFTLRYCLMRPCSGAVLNGHLAHRLVRE